MTVAAPGVELTFQKELFFKCMAELPALFLAEWEETKGDKEHPQELDPAWDKYVDMELNGTMVMFTARAGDRLVGYIISMIFPHLHFKKELYAFVDALYLAPEYRHDGLDEEFVGRNEMLLMGQRVQEINAAIPASAWQYHLMKKLQYNKIASIFSKRL